MIIPLTKLMPLLVIGGIAMHSKDAISKRLSAVIGPEFVLRHNMSSILTGIQLHTIGELDLKIKDERQFIRDYVSQKSGDPSLDPWRTPYRIFFKQNRIFLISAGPDKAFATKDDVGESIELLNN